MALLKESDLFDMSRKLLRCIGMDPLHFGGIVFKINGLLTVCAFLTLGFLLLQTFIHIDGGVQYIAASANSFTIYYQVEKLKFLYSFVINVTLQLFSKLLLFIYYKNEIADIIKEFINLWSLETISDDPEEAGIVQGMLRIYKLAMCTFVTLGTVHFASFIVVPALVDGRRLPYYAWLPPGDSDFYYYAVFIIENYVILVLLFLVCGTDSLFIALCGTTGVQFRLLSHKMRNLKIDLGEEMIRRTLRECIVHQKHLTL